MVTVAGEVADGLITHPFTTRQSLREITLPALERGLAASGRSRARRAGGVRDARRDRRPRGGARPAQRRRRAQQLAFYGSTPGVRVDARVPRLGRPAPRAQPAVEGRAVGRDGRAHRRRACSRPIAVVGEPATIAAELRARLDGIADAVSLTNNRAPDPDHWAGVVADLKRGLSSTSELHGARAPTPRGPRRTRPGRSGRTSATPVEEHAERDPTLEAGEARARAHVRAAAERDVAARIRPVEPERVRVVEHVLVAVGREDAERHLVAGCEVLAVQIVRPACSCAAGSGSAGRGAATPRPRSGTRSRSARSRA